MLNVQGFGIFMSWSQIHTGKFDICRFYWGEGGGGRGINANVPNMPFKLFIATRDQNL